MPKRFVLHGILGAYNYGCEGIIRGTVKILRESLPDCEIAYLSQRPQEDGAILSDCPLEVLDYRPSAAPYPRRLLRGALRRAGMPYRWVPWDSMDWLRPRDVLISIGGDIFTLGPGPYPAKADVPKLDTPNRIVDAKCPFVLWGASVGPFEAWPESVPVFRRFLNRLALITAREPRTVRYLKRLGIEENVREVADPAYLMEPEIHEEDFPFSGQDKLTVGVNLSPLSAAFNRAEFQPEETRERQAVFLAALVERLDCRLMLIPHVIAPHEPIDDDYAFLKDIHDRLAVMHPGHSAIAPANLGARRTKGLIARCDVLLAARMHCAVAGVSSGVPTLFVAYSAKALGMAELIYGHLDWSVEIRDLCHENTLAQIEKLVASRSEVSAALDEILPPLRQKSLLAGAYLREVVEHV